MTLPTDHTDIPLAIVGMACRLPGAGNLEEYWRLIIEGRSAVGEVPADRLDREIYFTPQRGVRGRTYSTRAALLEDREFHRDRCPLPEDLVRSVDPTHLLMTEVAAEALRQAGLDPFDLPTRNAGVFIGHAQGSSRLGDVSFRAHVADVVGVLEQTPAFQALPLAQRDRFLERFAERIQQGKADDGPGGFRHWNCNMVAGTIARAFGLTGHWFALNSACASSLHAMLIGARALQRGRAEMVIVGGASDCKPDSLVLFSQAQTLSTTDSRPFDAAADGLIMAEGYVALVMKTLDRALADGDPIQAVVRGLGVASDGRGKSLWAPRREGQIRAMQRAYRRGADVARLQYLECHATATQLGDATELETLREVLGSKFPPGRKIPISSIKANIGHTLEAAGIAGVIKTVLCMQHRTLPPAINVQTPNPKVNWDAAPFFISREPLPWNEPADGGPRMAAVNAFGIGGLNMHVVLEEFRAERPQDTLPQTALPATALPQRATGAAHSRIRQVESPDDRAIAIVGMACIVPGAARIDAFWDVVQSGRDAKCAPPEDRWPARLRRQLGPLASSLPGGFITDYAYDWRRHKVPPKQVAEADPLQFMLLDASVQALEDAGYDPATHDRSYWGVVVGTEFGGDFADQLQMGLRLPEMEHVLAQQLSELGVPAAAIEALCKEFGDRVLQRWPALVDETGSFTSSTLASRISKTLDLAGGAVSIDSGSTSALSGLMLAIDMLLSGDNDLVICAAGQRRMGVFAYGGLSKAGLLSATASIRNALDPAYDGIVPGEGVGVVVLKRLADARRDGDRIRAVIRGMGVAHHDRPDEAMTLATRRACAMAGIDPRDVRVVEVDTDENAEITRTQLGALAAAHGSAERTGPLVLSSPTAQFGHLGGAAPMVALLKSSLELGAGFVPSSFALDAPAPGRWPQKVSPAAQTMPIVGRRLGAVASWSKGQAFYVLLEHGTTVAADRQLVQGAPEQTSETSSLAAAERLAAQPASTVTSRAPVMSAESAVPATAAPMASALPHTQPEAAEVASAPRKERPAPAGNGSLATASPRIFRVAADSTESIRRYVVAALDDVAQTFASADRTTFTPSDRWRLAVVACSPEQLARKLQAVLKGACHPAQLHPLQQQGIFLFERPAHVPRVGFAFPGQGSQYTGMLKPLVEQLPAAARAMQQADAAMRGLGYPSFAELAWNDANALGRDVFATQAAMLLAEWIVLAALGELGIRADLVLGHSYGEFVALLAAGVWDLETAIRMTWARCQGIEAVASSAAGMLAAAASPDVIRRVIAQTGCQAYVANCNAPDQTVVGGKRLALERLAEALAQEGIAGRLLDVPAAFHTPLMAGASRQLQRALETAALHAPRIPVYSTVTNALVTEPDQVRQNLGVQLTSPVQYGPLIARLAEESATVLVEVGPQQTLTRLHRRILGQQAWAVASDNAQRAGLEPLCCVRAMLECLGAVGPTVDGESRLAAVPTSDHSELKSKTRGFMDSYSMDDAIPHFDATSRRRNRRRAASSQTETARRPLHGAPHENGGAATSAAPGRQPIRDREYDGKRSDGADRVEVPNRPSNGDAHHAGGLAGSATVAPVGPSHRTSHNEQASDGQTSDGPRRTSVASAVADANPTRFTPDARTTPGDSTGSGTSAQALEKFLIQFVVEQTGYPPEVVDLDADLEADLGIDSIKKAQLFGELQEYFDVQTQASDLSLDHFSTLRHVLDFLVKLPQTGQTGAPSGNGSVVATDAAGAAHGDVPAVAGSITSPATPNVAPMAEPPPGPAADSNVPAATASPSSDASSSTAPSAGAMPTVSATNRAAEPIIGTSVDLEAFLVNFVVEQTGYPPEVVDLDADLEADLGIDSIKKAQLFGELQEYFDVGTSSTDLSLDDFPTLRHVLDFLRGSGAQVSGDGSSVIANEEPPRPAATAATDSLTGAGSAIGAAHASAARTPTSAPSGTVDPEGANAAAVASDAPVNGASAEQLEAFLVNFVVEQTGYPPEVVDLDADLEADLGIDSIKKAQLFGELQEYFDVGTSATDLSLDDFPTLRHVLDFLRGSGAQVSGQTGASLAEPSPLQPAAVVTSEPAESAGSWSSGRALEGATSEGPAAGGSWSGTSERAFAGAADAVAGAGAAFGVMPSTALGATTSLSATAADPDVVGAATAVSDMPTEGASAEQLEAFLVNFVVEQTGYPPEVVDLDADLEADLGIDSIKKAQLFGELQEYFDVGTSSTDLSLDDFPTLRHVLNYLMHAAGVGAARPADAPSPPAQPAAHGPQAEAGWGEVAARSPLAELPLAGEQPVELSGSPYQMGWQHGKRFFDEIRSILRVYVEQLGDELAELPGSRECQRAHEILSADELDELQGIADAVGVPLVNILAHHFAVGAEMVAQGWQGAGRTGSACGLHVVRHRLPLVGAWHAAIQPVVFSRRPARGLMHAAVGLAGTVHLLAGVNAARLSASVQPVRGAVSDAQFSSPLSASTLVRNVLEQAADIAVAKRMTTAHKAGPAFRLVVVDGAQSGQVQVLCPSDVGSAGTNDANVGRSRGTASTTSVVAAGNGRARPTAGGSEADGEEAGRVVDDALQDIQAMVAGGCIEGSSPAGLVSERCDTMSVVLDLTTWDAWVGIRRVGDGAAVARVSLGGIRSAAADLMTSRSEMAIETPVVEAYPPQAETEITRRFTLQMRDAPLAPGSPDVPRLHGAAIILGAGPVADALEQRLGQLGQPVHRISPNLDINTATARLESICQQAPAPHLFITTPREDSAANVRNDHVWRRQQHQSMELPFFVCQKWLQLAAQAGWIDRCTLAATVGLGGDFGFARGGILAQGGAVAGLLKGIFIEFAVMQGLENLRVKVIDAPLEMPAEQLAGHVLRELACSEVEFEVAYDGDRRRVPSAVDRPAVPVQDHGIRRGATWVVTGGARGITAACALELAKRYGLKLHLIGSTPLPEIDPQWHTLSAEQMNERKRDIMIAARQAGQPAAAAWEAMERKLEIDRNLRAYQAAGVPVTYHACDVTDREALAATLEAIRRAAGPIEGVLHGAGIDRSCRMERKQPDVVLQTIRIKVGGAANLMALTREDPVRHFIGFGSISGRFGSFGQADYCLASDMLCKLIGAYRRERPWIRAVGIHWHGWDSIGMASRPETQKILRTQSELRLMSPAEGIGHLVRELLAGVPVPEVLITETRHWKRFDDAMRRAAWRGGKAPTDGATSDGANSVVATAPTVSAEAVGGNGTIAGHDARPAVAKSGAAAAEHAASADLDGRAGAALAEALELRTRRYGLRMIDAPLANAPPSSQALESPVWILGENALADVVRRRLAEFGIRTEQFRPSEGLERLEEHMDRLWQHQPAKALLVLTGRDIPPEDLLATDAIARRRDVGIVVPYFVAQRWVKKLRAQPALGQGTLVATVALGGDFGFSGDAELPDGGALCGLLKSIYIEDSRSEAPRLRCKVIDAPSCETDEAFVDAMLAELAANEPEVEVAWSAGRRRVVRPIPTPLATTARRAIAPGGVWVVAGGARGITAIAAREMAKRYAWRLHLLGTSPAPQSDAPWRNYSDKELQAFKTTLARQAVAEGRSPSAAWDRVLKDVEIFNNLALCAQEGVQATYHQCDVTDWQSLATVLQRIRRDDGPITGILHGAGLIEPGRFEHKRRGFVEKLVKAKFDGLLNILSLTQEDPLRYCIGFGSISGRFGGNGLSDYAVGNDVMAKILDWLRRRRPDCAAMCIEWESWEGAGIAVMPRFAWGPRTVMKMKYMMPEEGVHRLEQEWLAGMPDSEVLYSFGDFYPMFYPHEQRPLGEFIPEAHEARGASAEPSDDSASSGPILANLSRTASGYVGQMPLDPTSDPFLDQHRLRGKPLLPVVVSLEAVTEAAMLASGREVVELREIQMVDGLAFHADRPVTARVEVADAGGDMWTCALRCDFRNRAGGLVEKDRVYLRAAARVVEKRPELEVYEASPPADWLDFSYPDQGPVYHGPVFRALTGVHFDRAGGWGRIEALPLAQLAGPARVGKWHVPSVVLDAALYACGAHLFRHGDRAISLPRYIQSVELVRPVRDGQTCYVHFECRDISERSAHYDLTVVGQDRAVMFRVRGYEKVILARGGVQ